MYLPEIKDDYSSRDIFSKLLTERIIFIAGELTDEVALVVVAELLYLDHDSHEDISIYINSPGGSVTAGFAILDTMNCIESEVVTICVGQCASMASIILSGGSKGKRFALENSEIMIHQPLAGVKGQATDIEITAKHVVDIRNRIYRKLAENTCRKFEEIQEACDRDNYLSAKAAVEYGLIDKIVNSQ